MGLLRIFRLAARSDPEDPPLFRLCRGDPDRLAFALGRLRAARCALRGLCQRTRERPYASHNPLGAYAVLALLGFVLVQSSLGLVAVEHNWTTWGPLSHLIKDGALQSRLTKLHGQFFYWGLLILVGIHVAAALYHSIFRGEPLVRAMVTGRKPAHRYADADAVIGSQWSTGTTIGAALGWLAVSMALFGGVIVTLGGKIFY